SRRVDDDVGGTGDYRTLDVTNDHSLLAGSSVAAAIGSCPGHQVGAHRELCQSVARHGYRATVIARRGTAQSHARRKAGSSIGINGYVGRTCDCRKLSISDCDGESALAGVAAVISG